PRGADALLAALRDPDPLVRSLAARGLRPQVADSAGRREPARTGLRLALDDEHPHVRINALRALATFADEALVPAVARLLGDADPNVVLAAVEALGSLGGAHAAARALRAQVAASAGRREPARTGLRLALDDEHPHVRINALRALATFADEALVPAVARLLGDADPNVVLAAVEALGSLGGAHAAA